MKRIYKVIIILTILFGILVIPSSKVQQLNADLPEVIDLSNTIIPSYKLPPGAKITKEEEIEGLSQRIERCREGKEFWDSRFPDGAIPTRVQVITIPYGEFTRIFFDNKDASVLTPKDKVYILVLIDIKKTFRQAVADMKFLPPGQLERWERQGLFESNRQFVCQEYQLIDPLTDTVVEWGYNKKILILPRQESD